jgi:hypothetical protein
MIEVVWLAVVVHHEAASLLEDEPDGGPHRDAGERTEKFLNLGRITDILDLKVYHFMSKGKIIW